MELWLLQNRRRLAGLLAATVIGLFGMSQAWADDYAKGGVNGGYKPDSDEHTFCLSADYTGSNPVDGAIYAMDNLEQQTNMTKNRVPDCNENTDAKFNIQELGGNDGEYECLDRINEVCYRAVLRFDRSNITSLDDWKQTACHEVGHSVGLSHGLADDCMGSQHQNQSDRIYGTHHVQHINCRCDSP